MTLLYPPSDESLHRLHRAGWSAGEAAFAGKDGLAFWVTGMNGENLIKARGDTMEEAWWRAVQQAEAVGMIGRGEIQRVSLAQKGVP
jgi:hypothetical protein